MSDTAAVAFVPIALIFLVIVGLAASDTLPDYPGVNEIPPFNWVEFVLYGIFLVGMGYFIYWAENYEIKNPDTHLINRKTET